MSRWRNAKEISLTVDEVVANSNTFGLQLDMHNRSFTFAIRSSDITSLGLRQARKHPSAAYLSQTLAQMKSQIKAWWRLNLERDRNLSTSPGHLRQVSADAL